VIILSIVVPVSLLATFRITGILREPMTWETVSLDPVSWSLNRPSNDTMILEWVNNSYNGTGVSITLGILVTRYFEDDLYFGDYIQFELNVATNVTEGFIDSVVIRYQLNPTSSDMMFDDDWFTLRNLKLQKIEFYEQYATTVGINQPQNCSLKHLTFWTMGYDNDVEQAVKATAKILCWNGTAYQKIQVPIDLFVHAMQTP
jgi:hypothetical protein